MDAFGNIMGEIDADGKLVAGKSRRKFIVGLMDTFWNGLDVR